MVYAVIAGEMKYPVDEKGKVQSINMQDFAQMISSAVGHCVEQKGMMPLGGVQVLNTVDGIMFMQSMITVEMPSVPEHRTKPRKLSPGTLN